MNTVFVVGVRYKLSLILDIRMLSFDISSSYGYKIVDSDCNLQIYKAPLESPARASTYQRALHTNPSFRF